MSEEISWDVIEAMMVGPRATSARTFPPGRTCGKPGCGARPSVYNPSSVCGLHAQFEALAHVARSARQRDSGRAAVLGPSRVAA